MPADLGRQINSGLRRVPVWLVWVVGLMPAFSLPVALVRGGLGPDPVRPLEHELGHWALRFLIAALCVTPILRHGGVNLMRFRRALGLLAVVYALLHLLVWLLLDMQLRLDEILRDLLRRPYITIGMLALLLLLPLAWTSRDAVLRRMGPQRWRRLHLLAWPATVAAAIHYIMVLRIWEPQVIVYTVIILLLVMLRFVRGHRPIR